MTTPAEPTTKPLITTIPVLSKPHSNHLDGVASYSSENYKTEVIFCPPKVGCNADLCFEIWDDDSLKGVIPCYKEFISDNAPVVAAKFRDGSNLTNEDGLSIFKIEGYNFKPELVCEFVASFFDGKLDLRFDNIMDFYSVADFFGCTDILKSIKNVVKDNIVDGMSNTMLVKAWSHGETFKKSCLNFIEGIGLRGEDTLQKIGQIDFDHTNFDNFDQF